MDKKIIIFKIDEHLFPVYLDELERTYPRGILLTKLYSFKKLSGEEITENKTVSIVNVESEIVKLHHVYSISEWLKIPEAQRKPQKFVKNMIIRILENDYGNYQSSSESDYIFMVDDLSITIPNNKVARFLFDMYIGMEYIGCSDIYEAIEPLLLLFSWKNYIPICKSIQVSKKLQFSSTRFVNKTMISSEFAQQLNKIMQNFEPFTCEIKENS